VLEEKLQNLGAVAANGAFYCAQSAMRLTRTRVHVHALADQQFHDLRQAKVDFTTWKAHDG
jgi:hypothetical protein